ncbi:acVLRF1 family peptidyl-tRNA hydrolase [Cumulibacter manganitolerans]|uniref:acVLRF1 family peptidyl-tRNA hydrolase n=1 Tax=Cumulibacter manganitolerans TaxID=1884992 RepID=UPI001297E91C|nr:acVLRF1 family peptidyl-tRNA hydrolase [Cumulibacter manganitolerans]
MTRDVTVPPGRIEAWFRGFEERNGRVASITAADGTTQVRTERGAAVLITDPRAASARHVAELTALLLPRESVAVVLVRRGGYSIGRGECDGSTARLERTKTGTRYVQGRTAAGGQSQQRFARRRANQTAALVVDAAQAARAVLGDRPAAVDLLVTGGDPQLVEDLLGREPLRRLRAGRHVQVATGEPRRASLDDALDAARAVRLTVTNADPEEGP